MKPLILHFLVVKFLHIQTTSELNEHCPYAISNLFVLLMPKQEVNAISWLRAEQFIKKKSSTTTRHLGLKNLINVVIQTTICLRLSTYHYSLAVIDCKKKNGRTAFFGLGKIGKRVINPFPPSLPHSLTPTSSQSFPTNGKCQRTRTNLDPTQFLPFVIMFTY